MKKSMIIMLALAALMISVPAVMARDANWSALNKVWSDREKQENQQKMERQNPDSEWDTADDREPTDPDTGPKLIKPGRR
jgi:hypothetical protein